MNLAEKIKDIDLSRLVQAEGVDLRRSGQSWRGLCPFHEDKTPSFAIKENRFRCWGCGAHGDSIDFIRALKGLSLPEACSYFGIPLPGKPITPVERREAKAKAQERKQRQILIDAFRRWEINYSTKLGKHIRGAYRWIATNVKCPEDLEGTKGDAVAEIYKKLPFWERALEILACGSDKEKYQLYRGIKK